MARKSFARREFLKSAVTAGAGVAATESAAHAAASPVRWAREADVIVVGAGAVGLAAAIEAKEKGASVLVVEANKDVGGHAILSAGNIPLGGGTRAQKEAGIVDSPDLIFSDLTDWSIVQPNGAADYRFNDRDLVRAFADNNVDTFDWLAGHGVTFIARAPDTVGGNSVGNSVPRMMHCAVMAWPLIQSGKAVAPERGPITSGGVGLMRPLEAAARKLGIPILLQHKMTGLIRESAGSRRVAGIVAETKNAKINLRAKKGVIIGTGGHSSNVNFRRIFDPRLTEEYCGTAGEPYSLQDASGEIAAMAVGASLWGTANQTAEFGIQVAKPGRIGCQYGYVNLVWEPTSEYFHLARATGLNVRNYQDVICVNQAGLRFCDETKGQFPANNAGSVPNYAPHSHANAASVRWAPANYLPAAMGLNGGTGNGGGPIWAIFDADAVKRAGWNPAPPDVDIEAGFFFSANTIAGLADKIRNKYQKKPIPAAALEATVARYNSFVDAGKDADFQRPAPRNKIQTPPFYAAWATPVPHDSKAGLRINARCQVQDMEGKVIPGLYCGGESAGGFSEHGVGRAIVQGRIAARNAAAEKV